MKNNLVILGLSFISLAFWACGSSSSSDSTPAPTTKLKYADVSATINTNCATSGCHSSAQRADGIDLSTHAGVKANAAKAAEEITKKGMPPPDNTLNASFHGTANTEAKANL